AADTVVVFDGEALGKPAGPEEARAMLRRLRGREHEVITGVAVVDTRTGREATRAVASRVRMAAYSDVTLDSYVASGAPLDKAGAYAIQDLGGALVENFAGSYTNVVGLPVEETRGRPAEPLLGGEQRAGERREVGVRRAPVCANEDGGAHGLHAEGLGDRLGGAEIGEQRRAALLEEARGHRLRDERGVDLARVDRAEET